MKESNTLAGNAIIKPLQRTILRSKERAVHKGVNTLAGNATMRQHQMEILLDTDGQYMKESSTLTSIVDSNLYPAKVSQSTEEIFVLAIIVQLDKKN